MPDFLNILSSGFDLALVILGFGLIIFFHELGHFVAARWAGIRVLAFAIGFGPALLSYRKGLGWRRGSSAAEYEQVLKDRAAAAHAAREEARMLKEDAPAAAKPIPSRSPGALPPVSPTEYRLNIIPFGGYVKMLGQDDADPSVRSDEPDGYQQTKVWKRMIVISAGVVANFLVAAVLFVIVFMFGLKTEPAIVGVVEPGSPAARAVALNARALNVIKPGLQAGDEIIGLNGDKPDDFSDVLVATAMARKGRAVHVEVKRAGYAETLQFDITPRQDLQTKLLQIGIGPAPSAQVVDVDDPTNPKFAREMTRAGLPGVRPKMIMTRAGDVTNPATAYVVDAVARRAAGAPIDVTLHDPAGAAPDLALHVPSYRKLPRRLFFPPNDERPIPGSELLGLVPVLTVDSLPDPNEKSPARDAGLKEGDLFVQLGSVEWPSVPEGIAQVRSAKGQSLRVVVLRKTGDAWSEVDLGDIPVSEQGTIGFFPDESWRTSTLVTAWPRALARGDPDDPPPEDPPASALSLMRGSRISSVDGQPVANFIELTNALISGTRAALDAGEASAVVTLTVELPVRDQGGHAIDSVKWTLPRSAIEELHALPWTTPILTDTWPAGAFQSQQIVLKASGPIDAVGMGLRRTERVMAQTYLTFSRLFQGSVKVEHLKGPVGIASIGTVVARRGTIALLFFMALISVNLGVVNFLPIPIADGGHFVFLLYEQFTGKPVSVAVQNIAALAGLILVVGMFLLVTFNDIAGLFRG